MRWELPIKEEDLALLVLERRRGGPKKYLVRVRRERFHTHRGFVDLGDLIGAEWGTSTKTSRGDRVLVLPPTAAEVIEKFPRKTQIAYPKDIAFLLMRADVKPGDVVVEGGTGSGALAFALSRAVGGSGRVVTYEIDDRFLKLAKKNLERLGATNVEFKLGDITSDVVEEEVDSFFIDIGDPWNALSSAWRALKPGRPFAALIPSCEQIPKLVNAAREEGFGLIEVHEILDREYDVDERRTRPSARMIGHTAFLVVGRKMLRD